MGALILKDIGMKTDIVAFICVGTLKLLLIIDVLAVSYLFPTWAAEKAPC